jgi:hypothetical protein
VTGTPHSDYIHKIHAAWETHDRALAAAWAAYNNAYDQAHTDWAVVTATPAKPALAYIVYADVTLITALGRADLDMAAAVEAAQDAFTAAVDAAEAAYRAAIEP